jgi:hypothetical protein
MEARAEARYLRVSPQKARLVVDLIRGRSGFGHPDAAVGEQADRAHGREGVEVGHRQCAQQRDESTSTTW